MADVRARVRERLQADLPSPAGEGGSPDAAVLTDVEALLRRACDRAGSGRLLLQEFLGRPDAWRLQRALVVQTHRPGLTGRLLVGIKRSVLLPLLRWLFEYSRDNFERQQRVNEVLFACVQELATENARLRARLPPESR